MERLFVYGTLAPGRSNHHVMADIPGNWESATLRGHLLEEGWGAAHGCPGIVPAADGEIVAGFLFSSTALSAHWGRLDDFEGEGYERVAVTVQAESSGEVDACVYALRRR